MRKFPEEIKLHDMKSLVHHFPDMLAWFLPDMDVIKTCRRFHKEGVDGICFVGMGGSSIAGQYVRELLNYDIQIPTSVVQNHHLPKYVSEKWVVITTSYSGNTFETLSSMREAEKRGSRVILITSGGQMQEANTKHPCLLIPEGLQPRAALPLLFGGLLAIIQALVGIEYASMKEVADHLATASKSWGSWIPKPVSLAETLQNKVPLFIGAECMRPVAYRAKCQINENAKAIAFNSQIPEATHNEIEGFESLLREHFVPVFVRRSDEDIHLRRIQDVLFNLYKDQGLNPISLSAAGNSRIVDMLSMTHYLDMVSVELASLRGVDPLGVKRIASFKRALAEIS
jgi:glucose/mannose-6-phosphate isomerase